MHVTSHEREIFEAYQRRQAQLLDDERAADVRQVAELSQTSCGERPRLDRHAAADDRASQRALRRRVGVAVDGPTSKAIRRHRRFSANVFEIDLFVQRNVVGAEHAGRLRRRGACEQQKHGCRSHHDGGALRHFVV